MQIIQLYKNTKNLKSLPTKIMLEWELLEAASDADFLKSSGLFLYL